MFISPIHTSPITQTHAPIDGASSAEEKDRGASRTSPPTTEPTRTATPKTAADARDVRRFDPAALQLQARAVASLPVPKSAPASDADAARKRFLDDLVAGGKQGPAAMAQLGPEGEAAFWRLANSAEHDPAVSAQAGQDWTTALSAAKKLTAPGGAWSGVPGLVANIDRASTLVDEGNAIRAGAKLVRPGDDVAAIVGAAKAGDTIRLSAGTFEVRGTIRVPEGVTLEGAGQSATRLVNQDDTDEAAHRYPVTLVASGRNAIRDLTLDGGRSDTRAGTFANLRLEGNGNEVSRVTSQRSGGSGLEIVGSNGNSVADSTFAYNHGSGAFVIDSARNTFVNDTATGNGGHGIGLHRSSDNTIEGCGASRNQLIGIAEWQADRNTIRNNVASANGAEGITVDHGSSHNVISGNTLLGNCTNGGVGGIGIDGGRDADPSQPAQGNLISGNTIKGTLHAYAGITTQNNEGPASGNTIRDNVIEQAGGPGVWLKYQEYPGGGSTNNRGPTSSDRNRVLDNTITVTDFPAGANVLVVDGTSAEALEKNGQRPSGLDATAILPDGRTFVLGAGSRNVGNVLLGNHA